MSPGLFVVIVTERANTHPLFFFFFVIANVILIYSLFSPFFVSPVNVLGVELCDLSIDIFWFYKMVAET